MFALLFAVQEPPSPPVAGPARPPVPAPLIARQPCRPDASGSDVVVCGSRSAEERYRLRPLSDRYEEKPLVAAVRLGEGTTAALAAEQQNFGNGLVSKRIMLNFKILLGGPKKRAK